MAFPFLVVRHFRKLERQSVVHVRNLQCNDPVEPLYYSADYEDICVYCSREMPSSSRSECFPQCAEKPKINRRKADFLSQPIMRCKHDVWYCSTVYWWCMTLWFVPFPALWCLPLWADVISKHYRRPHAFGATDRTGNTIYSGFS